VEAEQDTADPVCISGEVALGISAHDPAGDGVLGLEIEAVGGSGEGRVLADGRLGESVLVEADVSRAVVAAAVDGQAEALAEVAGQAGVPTVLGHALQVGAGLKAQIASTDVRLIEM